MVKKNLLAEIVVALLRLVQFLEQFDPRSLRCVEAGFDVGRLLDLAHQIPAIIALLPLFHFADDVGSEIGGDTRLRRLQRLSHFDQVENGASQARTAFSVFG